jgi:aldehyde:ferredoxin oxidoreductase
LLAFHSQILIVDLNKREYKVKRLSSGILKKYLGGKGLASYLMLKKIPPKINPFSPENKIIFATGPATATAMPTSGKYGVYAKSPLTYAYAESYSGGQVAPKIKASGYDALIIEGASRTPVYLEISDSEVKIQSAEHLWGLDTYAAEEVVLKDAEPGAQAVVIGIAGENLVRFACIENNRWRSAGRCGLGAVMGVKKLKAIVFQGSKQCRIADEEKLEQIAKKLIERGMQDKAIEIYRKYGTPSLVAIVNAASAFPTRYWQKGYFENYLDISAESWRDYFEVQNKACYNCFIACGKLSTVKSGKYKGIKVEGPEYETIYAFGGLCEVKKLDEIAYLNDLCDKLGMDTISAGNIIAFAIEARKRGKLDINVEYGNVEQIAELLQMIAQRKNSGSVLAEGIKLASENLGLQELAIHVKGLEPAGYDPRVLKGTGLGYAISPRGACHLRATFYKPELSGIIDPSSVSGKAKLFVEYEDKLCLQDSLIICRFLRDLLEWLDYSLILEALTGLKLNEQKLRAIASGIITLARSFNAREGFDAKADILPKRFFKEPIVKRDRTLAAISEEEIGFMKKEYYELRNWSQNGIPKAKL